MTPEGKIGAYLVRRVRELGGEQRKVEWSGRRGAPDRLILFPHVHAFAELKAPGQKPEPHQARELERLRAAGFSVYVVDSKASVDAMLGRLLARSLAARLAKGEYVAPANMKEGWNAPHDC